ncbi:MAG: DUF4397 domain-containing protein [Chloroflexota bacterium]
MKQRFSIRKLSLMLVILLTALAACDTGVPPAPPITVVITVVPNTAALQQAVVEALDGTQQASLAQTATVFAQGGVTYTPSPTLTPSETPTITPTRYVTSTPTPLPSDTPTPTYAPFLTTTPVSAADAPSWVRVLHAWQDVAQTGLNTSVDVYFNDERIGRDLQLGEQTNYLQLAPGQLRVTLRDVDANLTTPTPLKLNNVVDIPPGVTLSLVMVDLGTGLQLLPVSEDLSPISSGLSRVTVIQANPELLPVNLLFTDDKRALASNLTSGDVLGPMEIPSKSYLLDGFNADETGQLLFTLPRLNLVSRLNYILVMIPFRGQEQRLTDGLVFSGNTRLIDEDLNARFVNFAPNSGPLTVSVDGQAIFTNMPVGAISAAIPLSATGSNLTVADANGRYLYYGLLGPWTADNERKSDKIVLLGDAKDASGNGIIAVNTVSQNAPRSAINANLRLIHALPGGSSLSLEILRVSASQGSNGPTWIPLASASAGTASAYVPRTPEILDVRVVQTGTRNVIAQLQGLQILPGGMYDFVALPGTEVGSFRLELMQPIVQFTTLAIDKGDPTAIAEAVQATLTAQAPAISPTPTSQSTSTATPTPVATNTPRPTNTPNVLPPTLIIDPAPPDTAVNNFSLIGQNFSVGKRFVIFLDADGRELARGTVNNNGSFQMTIKIPVDVTPGPHIIQVCVDCRAGGIQQAQYTSLLVAGPNATPSPTPKP